MPGCFYLGILFYLTKRTDCSIDRKAAPKKEQTCVGNQLLENLAIISFVSIASAIFTSGEDTAMSAISFAVQPKKTMRFVRQSSRCLIQPRSYKLTFKMAIGSIINPI